MLLLYVPGGSAVTEAETDDIYMIGIFCVFKHLKCCFMIAEPVRVGQNNKKSTEKLDIGSPFFLGTIMVNRNDLANLNVSSCPFLSPSVCRTSLVTSQLQ